jgi:hypothetical protein
MKNVLLALSLGLCAGSAVAQDVGVSVHVSQPGFYGEINIGQLPQPQVIYPQPVVVVPAPVGVMLPPPVYLHVPPGHQKHWEKHCRDYNACGRPVYFVQENWYQQVYLPQYYREHGDEHYEYRGDDYGHDEGHGHGHDHGHGHGHGHGHDHDD